MTLKTPSTASMSVMAMFRQWAEALVVTEWHEASL